MDIDPDDPEAAAAATRIQAGYRGHKTRQEIKGKVRRPRGQVTHTSRFSHFQATFFSWSRRLCNPSWSYTRFLLLNHQFRLQVDKRLLLLSWFLQSETKHSDRVESQAGQGECQVFPTTKIDAEIWEESSITGLDFSCMMTKHSLHLKQ